MREQKYTASVLESYPLPDTELVNNLLREETGKNHSKIVVLDDDPTGVQTVHDVSVYTDWTRESIREGFSETSPLFFILTNSRGFTREQTEKAHREIGENIAAVAKELQMSYLIISRSDSTLRGHYPLETEVLCRVAREKSGIIMNGEILCPYFREGGRFTMNNVHYVKYGEELIPAADTEFARDETFGYSASHLFAYVEEKTEGRFKKSDCIGISLESLRSHDLETIERELMGVDGFGKIIVNAVADVDVKVFCIALFRAMRKGRHFMIRCAASLVKAIGCISDQPLLTRSSMVKSANQNGGILVAGSHTAKTTRQLEELKKLKAIAFIELNSDLVLQPGALETEVQEILKRENTLIASGITVCVSTKRQLLKVEGDTPEDALVRSVQISNALQACVGRLSAVPAFVVAKGGITSSDVGVKALGVRKARVLGQIQPGVPVWQTGEESRFPGIPYVIFPGNVGEDDTLRRAVQILSGEEKEGI